MSCTSSKSLLVKYVESDEVADALGHDNVQRLLTFMRSYVFPHESHYVHYKFKHIRTLDEYSNSPLEGTNKGLKYNSSSVLPAMSLGQSSKVMGDQDETKMGIYARSVSRNFNETPLYTNTDTSRRLTVVAECMLREQVDQIECYASVRLNTKTWLVMRCAASKSMQPSPIPKFQRVCRVTRNLNGKLECSCGYYNRYGCPDRHTAHVAEYYGKDFTGFKYTDVAPRFWRDYALFVAVADMTNFNSEQKSIYAALQTARQFPSSGPHLPNVKETSYPYYVCGKEGTELFQHLDVHEARDHFETTEKTCKVTNYPCDVVGQALSTGGFSHASGLTQDFTLPDKDRDFDQYQQGFEDLEIPDSGDDNVLYQAKDIISIAKEAAQVLDGCDVEEVHEAVMFFRDGWARLKAKLCHEVSGTVAPIGSIISSAPKAKRNKLTHDKQQQFH